MPHLILSNLNGRQSAIKYYSYFPFIPAHAVYAAANFQNPIASRNVALTRGKVQL